MILFYDSRNGQIFGTVDGRVHDPEFTKIALMGSSNIPPECVGKFIVPTKIVIEEIEEPVVERFANPNKGFKIEERIIGTQKIKKNKELTFDVPFAALLHRHEDPKDQLKLINCRVILNEKKQIIDIVENSN